jgi:hypothetical protein
VLSLLSFVDVLVEDPFAILPFVLHLNLNLLCIFLWK